MTQNRDHGDTSNSAVKTSVSRRRIVVGLGVGTAGVAAGVGVWKGMEDSVDHHGFSLRTPQTPEEALLRLRAGNECYIAEHFEFGSRSRTMARRKEVASAQHPYAIVLACADSRVSPEVIFSAGLGDLFVVRVAGNIVDPRCMGVLGSIEYAIQELKIPLVIVLGHESCGAVKAAVHAVETRTQPPSAIAVLTDAIRPVIERADAHGGDGISKLVEANVRQQTANLLEAKEIVEPAATAGTTRIVGGVYELNTGRVRMLKA